MFVLRENVFEHINSSNICDIPTEHLQFLIFDLSSTGPAQFHRWQALWALFPLFQVLMGNSLGQFKETAWPQELSSIWCKCKRVFLSTCVRVWLGFTWVRSLSWRANGSNDLARSACVCALFVRSFFFPQWKINVQGEEGIDPRPSSTWYEEMSTTWMNSEQFSAAM